MKGRIYWLILAVLIVLTSVACAPTPPSDGAGDNDTDAYAVSVERLCEAMSLDEVHAAALLDLLAQMEFTGEVLFAYPATDDSDIAYYHIWIGERTVDVYMKEDDTVAAVQRSGVLLYGAVPAPSTPPAQQQPEESEPSEPVTLTITVDSHTASVEVGCDGYVRAFGEPGVEYKIKVYYASGVSTAKALSPQIAGQDGSLVWEWTVSSRAKPGVYKIEIVCVDDARDMVTLPFEVIAASED